MARVEVSAIDYMPHKGDVLYNFRVALGDDSAWVVSRSYDSFVELHTLLEKHYGATSLPHLTGPVSLWARSNDALRLHKLEVYLNGALAVSCIQDATLPDPNGGVDCVHVNKFICAFLELPEHTSDGSARGNQQEQHQQRMVPDSCAPNNESTTPAAAVLLTECLSTSPQPLLPQVRENNFAPSRSSLASSFSPLASRARDTSSAPRQSLHKEPVLPISQSAPLQSASVFPSVRSESQFSTMLAALEPKLYSIIGKESLRNESGEFALAAAVSTITSEMQLNVKDFCIHERDHIEYFLQVSICGHHWVVTKRYKQFYDLYCNLVRAYGVSTVPLIPHSRIPTWRKLTLETGEARKSGLNDFLQAVVSNVDSWEPRGLLASFELSRRAARKGETHFTVYINQILFDFLGFSMHIGAFSGEEAAKVMGEHRATLPEPVKMAYEKQTLHERHARMHERVSNNARRLQCMSDNQLQLLLDGIALLQDDRDIMYMFRRFLLTNEVNVKTHTTTTTSFLFADDIGDNSIMEEEKEGNTTVVIDTENAVIGVTARQLAKITQQLFFNDTKREAIRLFAGVLVDIGDVEEVFGSLWFEWEEAREELEHILSKD